MQRINALLMDIGNVLVRVDTELMRAGLSRLGVQPCAVVEKGFIGLCMMYEDGEIGTDAFLGSSVSMLGLEGAGAAAGLTDVYNAIFPDPEPIGVTVDMCRKLKGTGVRLVLFSNTNPLHVEYLKGRYPGLIELFDDAVYSFEAGGMKPGDAMYADAAGRLGLVPEQTLYFDDKPENVEKGREFGFRAHVFDFNRPESFTGRLPVEWLR